MTVAELIEELRKYPPDMVCVRTSGPDTFIEYNPIYIRETKIISDPNRHPNFIYGKEYAGSDDILEPALAIG